MTLSTEQTGYYCNFFYISIIHLCAAAIFRIIMTLIEASFLSQVCFYLPTSLITKKQEVL